MNPILITRGATAAFAGIVACALTLTILTLTPVYAQKRDGAGYRGGQGSVTGCPSGNCSGVPLNCGATGCDPKQYGPHGAGTLSGHGGQGQSLRDIFNSMDPGPPYRGPPPQR